MLVKLITIIFHTAVSFKSSFCDDNNISKRFVYIVVSLSLYLLRKQVISGNTKCIISIIIILYYVFLWYNFPVSIHL